MHLLKSWNKSLFLLEKSLTHGLHFYIASANDFLEHFCGIILFPEKSTLGRWYFINIKWNLVNHSKDKWNEILEMCLLHLAYASLFRTVQSIEDNLNELYTALWCSEINNWHDNHGDWLGMKTGKLKQNLLNSRTFFIPKIIILSFKWFIICGNHYKIQKCQVGKIVP